MVGGAPGTRGDPNDFGDYAGTAAAGQFAGDIISVVGGAITAIGGSAAVVAEGSTGVGALAIPVTAAIATEGAVTATAGLMNLLSDNGVVQANSNQGSGTGKGKNNRTPDKQAQGDGPNGGDHSVINDRGNSTYKNNKQNPTGFDEVKRTDVQGSAHRNRDGTKVETPHTHSKGSKDVRPSVKGIDY